MWTSDRAVPEQMPVLSRGKHRSPRKGACFMEMVSYLAGERWSDHPTCTHPLLATVARCVNDYTSDEARPRLAVLIPSVIGLNSDDLHVDARVALLAARAALPVAAAERQRVMAVAVLACEQVLNDLDGKAPDSLEDASRSALEQVPHAAQWARRYAREQAVSPKSFRRHGAPSIVTNAVKGIAAACVPSSDLLLHDLLAETISECSSWASESVYSGSPIEPERWAQACALTGTAVDH